MKLISSVLQQQRLYFQSQATLPIAFRLEMLHRLSQQIRCSEKEITEALQKDLHKSAFEAYETEIGIVLDEIRTISKNLKSWARPKRVSTPLTLFPGKSYIYSEPYGVCLIIAPWNYPFQLAIAPLLGAIAAGNCAIMKPSEYSPHTAQIIADLIQRTFAPKYVSTILGDQAVGAELLQEPFDLIFFTGGPGIAKIVMKAAAEHLTPVVLELGGKSPCIVDQNIDIAIAAKRIVWGKFLNAGQTCVAPDYVLAHEKIYAPLLDAMKQTIQDFYGQDPFQSPDYSRIISLKHFQRLQKLLSCGKAIAGGTTQESQLYISPTILCDVDWESAIMQEEIFGPILPVFSYSTWDQVKSRIHSKPKPLALYLFSKNAHIQACMTSDFSFGGGCINDTLVHVANLALPFGGIGQSGIGQYHGKASFDAFTHPKSVFKKPFWLDVPIRYPPYEGKMKWLKRFLG